MRRRILEMDTVRVSLAILLTYGAPKNNNPVRNLPSWICINFMVLTRRHG
jgi:hypothetical protein